MNIPKSFLPYHPLSNLEITDFMKLNKIDGEVISREDKRGKGNIVLNLDDKRGPGTHWTALSTKNKMAYYFDSFGIQPPDELLKDLKAKGYRVFYSDSKVQHDDSILCGYFCCVFLYWMNKGKDFYDFVYQFKQNGGEDDKLLKQIIEKADIVNIDNKESEVINGDGNISKIGNDIRYRQTARDVFYTPKELAKKLIDIVPLKSGDVVMDPFKGGGAFYNNFPDNVNKVWTEIEQGRDFFKYDKEVDWIISNPPFSILKDVFEHSIKIAKKGIAYIIGNLNMTHPRLKMMEDNGFALTKMHIFEVKEWFGSSYFVVFEKNKGKTKTEITYDTTIWKGDKGREQKKGSGFDLVEKINKTFPDTEFHMFDVGVKDGELQLTKYSFLGPGTHIQEHIANYDKLMEFDEFENINEDIIDYNKEPINEVDRLASVHDLQYSWIEENVKDKDERLKQLHEADRILERSAFNLMNKKEISLKEKVVSALTGVIMWSKIKLGLGKKKRKLKKDVDIVFLSKDFKKAIKLLKKHQNMLSEEQQAILASLLTTSP